MIGSMTTKFTFDDQANSLAGFFDNGRIFENKNVLESELRKLIEGLSYEVKILNDLIAEFLIQHDINKAVDLIDRWEQALGIPDDCFTKTTELSIDQRRRQCLVKFYMDSVVSVTDYKNLARILIPNVPIEIQHGGGPQFFFPLPFPVNFSSPGQFLNFIVRIHLPIALNPFVFPLEFPVNFSSGSTNIIQCIFNKIKPIHIKFDYIYDL